MSQVKKGVGYSILSSLTNIIGQTMYLQRKGLNPPPPGESEILGLEASGTISELGPGCKGGWKIGSKVMALLPGIIDVIM